mgnify:CR=1 FL=1
MASVGFFADSQKDFDSKHTKSYTIKTRYEGEGCLNDLIQEINI